MNSSQSASNKCHFNSSIDVNITDFVLTPLSCASLVSEIMKNLLYQRAQIPYPYAWLKNIVTKKRKSSERNSENNNFTVNRHYQTVSSVYDNVENIITNLNNEFTNSDNLKEIVIVFGTTPVCPKEVFTIKISTLAKGHLEKNHLLENNKKQFKIFRNIFLSDHWMNLLDNSIVCTNTYIYLKKDVRKSDEIISNSDSIFIHSKPLFLSPKVKHTIINLNYSESQTYSCCDDNIQVFQDSCDNDCSEKVPVIDLNFTNNSPHDEVWLQSKLVIKGFKDCFINKVPASELW